MKFILLAFLMVLILNKVQAQNTANHDSLTQKILKMDQAINEIHLNMVTSHKEFKTGTILIIAGTALMIAGAVTVSNGEGGDNSKTPTLLYMGAGITTIGTIIQIDSHKWIGRGGRRRK